MGEDHESNGAEAQGGMKVGDNVPVILYRSEPGSCFGERVTVVAKVVEVVSSKVIVVQLPDGRRIDMIEAEGE